jgi:hypothetical protein
MKRRRRVYPAGCRPVIGRQDRGAHREVAVSPLRTAHQGALPVLRGSEHHAILQVSRYGHFSSSPDVGQLGVAPDAPSVRLPPQLCSLFPGRSSTATSTTHVTHYLHRGENWRRLLSTNARDHNHPAVKPIPPHQGSSSQGVAEARPLGDRRLRPCLVRERQRVRCSGNAPSLAAIRCSYIESGLPAKAKPYTRPDA